MARRPLPTPQDYANARDQARKDYNKNPKDPVHHGKLAHALMGSLLNDWNKVSKHELQEAEDRAREAISLDHTTAHAYYALGFIYRLKGDHIAALTAFNEASNHDPDLYALAKAQAANEKVFLGHPNEAISDVDPLIQHHSKDQSIDVFNWIKGRAHFSLGQYKKAIGALLSSYKARDNLWFTPAWLVAAYVLDGQVTEAQKWIPSSSSPCFRDLNFIKNYYNSDVQSQFQKSKLGPVLAKLLRALNDAGWPDPKPKWKRTNKKRGRKRTSKKRGKRR